MSDPLVEGDRVVYWGMGDYVSPLFTPSVGDTVTVIPLQDGDSICIPKLQFSIGDHAWHAVDFPFAAFDWKLDFDFQLIPLIFSSLWGRFTGVGGDGVSGLADNVLEDKTQTLSADAQIGKYLHILSGYLKDQYAEILDNGTDWYTSPQTPRNLLNNSDCSYPTITTNWTGTSTNPFWGTGYWACYGSDGVTIGHGRGRAQSWSTYLDISASIWFMAMPAAGTEVSFYARFSNSSGTNTKTFYLLYGSPGAIYAPLQTITITGNTWKRYTFTTVAGGGIGFSLWAMNGWEQLDICNFTTGEDLSMYEMGFRVGDYYEIVDSPP